MIIIYYNRQNKLHIIVIITINTILYYIILSLLNISTNLSFSYVRILNLNIISHTLDDNRLDECILTKKKKCLTMMYIYILINKQRCHREKLGVIKQGIHRKMSSLLSYVSL